MRAQITTFWRHHGKPSRAALRAHPSLARKGNASDHRDMRKLMHQVALEAVDAGLPRPLFPFHPDDVVAVYRHKVGEGAGLWFALRDGRVFSSSGDRDVSDPEAYRDDSAS